MKLNLSIRCQTDQHEKCSGKPPSEAMAKFLAPELRDKRCECECHQS